MQIVIFISSHIHIYYHEERSRYVKAKVANKKTYYVYIYNTVITSILHHL